MSTVLAAKDRDLREWPESDLERKFIVEYLLSKGYSMADLREMPKEERRTLMSEACMYAAIRLANIEARSKFRRKIEAP